ncbi:MAG: DUF1573 domain-containing protein [Alistipes shahii]
MHVPQQLNRCQQNESYSSLSRRSPLFPPPHRPIWFSEPDTWDFGTIRESDGRVSHTFTGVNRGDKPLVILDVVTSCGCTVPEFSRQPDHPRAARRRITVTL